MNIPVLFRKTWLLLLCLCLAACDTPKSNLVRIESGSTDKINSLLEHLATRLPSNKAGIAIGYIEGENTTIAFIGNSAFTDKTLFEYGSITKVLTASILMQLVDDGNLQLNDSLNKFLPEDIQAPQWKTVTLRDLATHTAGIPNSPPA